MGTEFKECKSGIEVIDNDGDTCGVIKNNLGEWMFISEDGCCFDVVLLMDITEKLNELNTQE